jgi:hypothetical protein
VGLELADHRLVVRQADFISVEQLKEERFEGCPTGGVVLVLPDNFQANGKAPAIMDSFHDIERWNMSRAAGAPRIQLWRGVCR